MGNNKSASAPSSDDPDLVVIPPQPREAYASKHTACTQRNDGSKETTRENWQKRLTIEQYRVLRAKGTDPRGKTVKRGGFDDHFAVGTYFCAGCKTPLYQSGMKFDCGCGWPGFWTAIKDRVREERDADGRRVEIMCAACNGHLGHVFRGERFKNPSPNERHCVNSTSLLFKAWDGPPPAKGTGAAAAAAASEAAADGHADAG